MTLPNLQLVFNECEIPCSSIQKLYEKAQSAFKISNLRDAEQDLTDAMEAITHAMSMILSNRAIVRGIQGNIDNGLMDAYQIIDMNPMFPEGYLCAGALLSSEGRLTDALRIYKTGVRKLSIDKSATKNNQVEALHQRLADLQVEIDRNNAGIFKKLPQEVIAKILKWLSYRDKLQCTAACQTWRSHLYNNLTAAMWHELDFVGGITTENLELQLARIDPTYVREVSISQSCNALVSRHVLQFLARCSRIERLGKLLLFSCSSTGRVQ
ncbi:hypothetical protein BDB00DRAFT_837241 [Zychaea mexicana]|uniref:uncharacterized protein n=1 Tax=Zychaea mexicana TaxID=64656 RepID=UPI0022FDED89|nr:uncharacterized protein BDB00DRAFT_837241 [Zychaea mexicana]KAI9490601.1 hypothetical protein BDB00DRAFT_837241 [Zychaea mexicana]